jgi:hypothetical protein
MSEEESIKRRYREFLDLMPITLAIAGLPTNPGPRSFSNDQMEARAQVVANAFRLARQSVRDAIKG